MLTSWSFNANKQYILRINPQTFERMITWNDGESPNFVKKYSFLKTLL